MLPFIGKALSILAGMGSTGSAANNVGGVLAHALFIPALYYLWDHYNDIVSLKLPLWVLACVVAISYGLEERWRRSLPGAA